MAVGREFGHGYAGRDSAGYRKQADAAFEYAKKFPQLKSVTADTLGHRLVLTFADGWVTQVTPITDGKRGDVALRHLIKDEALAGRTDADDEPAGFGADDEIAIVIEGE